MRIHRTSILRGAIVAFALALCCPAVGHSQLACHYQPFVPVPGLFVGSEHELRFRSSFGEVRLAPEVGYQTNFHIATPFDPVESGQPTPLWQTVAIDFQNDGVWDIEELIGATQEEYYFDWPAGNAWPQFNQYTTRFRFTRARYYSGVPITEVIDETVPVTILQNPTMSYMSFNATCPTFASSFSGYLSPDGVFDRPLLIVEGIDTANSRGGDVFLGSMLPIASNLANAGYDVIAYNFANSNIDMRDNARGLQDAIATINSAMNGDVNHPIRVVGFSMGGVISRYALADNEATDGGTHNCDMFFSVDSPQQGAWINVDLQDLVIAQQGNFPEVATMAARLGGMASKQLLRINRFDNATIIPDVDHEIEGTPTYEAFYNELNAINGDGYPHLTTNIGMSFARGDLSIPHIPSAYVESATQFNELATLTISGVALPLIEFETGDIMAGSFNPDFENERTFHTELVSFLTFDLGAELVVGSDGPPSFIWAKSALDLWDVVPDVGVDGWGDIVDWGYTKFDEIYVGNLLEPDGSDALNHYHDDPPIELLAILNEKLMDCGDVVDITFPVGGETLFTDQTIDVTWDNCPSFTYSSHTVSYSTDGGQTYSALATVGGGSELATVTLPAGISSQCTIEIESLRASGETTVYESGIFNVTVGMLDATPSAIQFDDVNGVSWPDYNNDGNLDLCMTLASPGLWGDIALFAGDGNGDFDQNTSSFIVTSPTGHAWGDYNNDGLLDLYVGSDGGANKLFKNLGGGTFTEVNAPIIQDTGEARGVAWVDYNGTGRPDLFVANYNGPNKLFRNAGAGSWVDDSHLIAGVPEYDSNAGIWADYDEDGDQDLFITNYQDSDQLLRNDGAAGFSSVFLIPNYGYQSRGADWIDYDNDGDLDIFVVTLLGPEVMWENQGDGSFVSVTHGLSATTIEYDYMATWRDVANFGWLDPYFIVDGQNRGYTNLGYNGQGVSFLALGGGWHGDDSGRSGMAADYDNDGRMDLFFADTKSGAPRNFLLRNHVDYGGTHWLEFDLVGTEGSKDAIGAIVEVTIEPGGFGEYTMTRHVSGGSGYLSQPPLRLHFGLASSTEADVVVRWPSGQVEELHFDTVDRLITLVEPDIPPCCGGGCPYVYVHDGTEFVEQNTVLKAVDESMAGRKEADVRDSFVLDTAPVARDGEYEIEIREFERERTYLDFAGMIAFDHPEGSIFAVDAEGGFFLRDTELAKPISAIDSRGDNVSRLLSEADDIRFDGQPGDVVYLEFDADEIDPGFPMVARAVYKTPASPAMPRQAEETGISVARRVGDTDEYEFIGRILPRELASDQSVGADETLGALRAIDDDGGVVEIRLTWHTPHALDRIGWAKPHHGAMTANVLPVRQATWSQDSEASPQSRDVTGEVLGADDRSMELSPGERVALRFDALPESKESRTFVLDLEGHYVRLRAEESVRHAYGLLDNSPNPFNPTTTISFSLPSATDVSLRIFGADGRLVRSLAQKNLAMGEHALKWDGKDDFGRTVGSGVYFYTLDSEFGSLTQKMTLLK